MLLLMKIRYLDRFEKKMKFRDLSLDTKSLDPALQAVVEIIAQEKSAKSQWEILKYKDHFKEGDLESHGDVRAFDIITTVGSPDYTEDETGREITRNEIAQILSGSPTARMIPRGAKQHDIDLMYCEKKPVPIAEINLSPNDIQVLGYFLRELNELQDSAFINNGPGSLKTTQSPMLSSNSNPILETAVTDEEIRSFVTVFRKLYMINDVGNFIAATSVFVNAIGGHQYSKWAASAVKEYQMHLDSVPNKHPFLRNTSFTFTTKRLLDVFLYTQYAHQPKPDRQRQFIACLSQVHNKRDVLTWLFLMEIYALSTEILVVGGLISRWFKMYCDHHRVSPDVLQSLRDSHVGLGKLEKETDRRERLLREKVEQLASTMWLQAGKPEGGPSVFYETARTQLVMMLNQ